MDTKKRSTVIGVFATRDQGHLAMDELRRAGFSAGNITMVMHHPPKGDVEVTDLDAAKAAQVTGETKGEEGAAAGAITRGRSGRRGGCGDTLVARYRDRVCSGRGGNDRHRGGHWRPGRRPGRQPP